jgi:hypothetical protein
MLECGIADWSRSDIMDLGLRHGIAITKTHDSPNLDQSASKYTRASSSVSFTVKIGPNPQIVIMYI